MAEDGERRGERARRRDAGRNPRPGAPEPGAAALSVPEGPAITADEEPVHAAPEDSAVIPAVDRVVEEPPETPALIGSAETIEPTSTIEPSEPSVADDPAVAEPTPRTYAAGAGAGSSPPDDADRRSAEDHRRPSIVPALAALAVAILAAGWIYLYNQISAVQSDAQGQVADLRAKVAALEARPSPDLAGLTKRIDTVETEGQLRTQALTRRIDERPASGVDPKAIEAVHTQVTGLDKSLGDLRAQVASLPKPDFSKVDKRIDMADEQIGAAEQRIDKSDSRIGGVDQRLMALQAAVSAIPHIDLGPLTAKVDGLEARLKPVEAEAEAARSPQRVAERRAAPVAVTAQAIVEAIAAGQAFPKEFAALQVLGADPVKLAPLQPVAATGAPTLRELQASLFQLRDSIVAQGAPKPSGSYMDRLMAGAGSLVQVRPTGSVVGDTPAAIVARMDDEIGTDDLARALHEWDSLPEASRTVSKGLAERMRVRLDAENAAKSIAANAIDAMAGPRG